MTRTQSIFLILFLSIVLINCKHGTNSSMSAVVPMGKFKQTVFVPTLENKLSGDSNAIYSPAFLYAWNKLRLLNNVSTLLTPNSSTYLTLLDKSTSFQNSLDEDDYSADASLEDGAISARASFSKALPFRSELQKLTKGILFDHKMVKAFGMETVDEKIKQFINIVFYRDDNHFIITLTPEDNTSEIILAKGIENYNTMAGALKQINRLIAVGSEDSHGGKNSWKYMFNDDDKLSIPAIRFNIEANYKSVIGQKVVLNKKQYPIETAYQRTALTLDESGAIVESEATMESTDSVGAPQKSHPKIMIFDKPFFIIIKKAKKINPYLVVSIRNAELLEKM